MADCIAGGSSIQIGMTRSEIESGRGHDGGVAGIYKGERLTFIPTKPDAQHVKDWWKQKTCMINIDFHPYGLSDVVYNDVNLFAKWVQENGWHPNPKDVAVKVSAPYIDSYHFD